MICDPCQANFSTLLVEAERCWTIVSAGLCSQRTAYINSFISHTCTIMQYPCSRSNFCDVCSVLCMCVTVALNYSMRQCCIGGCFWYSVTFMYVNEGGQRLETPLRSFSQQTFWCVIAGRAQVLLITLTISIQVPQ